MPAQGVRSARLLQQGQRKLFIKPIRIVAAVQFIKAGQSGTEDAVVVIAFGEIIFDKVTVFDSLQI